MYSIARLSDHLFVCFISVLLIRVLPFQSFLGIEGRLFFYKQAVLEGTEIFLQVVNLLDLARDTESRDVTILCIIIGLNLMMSPAVLLFGSDDFRRRGSLVLDSLVSRMTQWGGEDGCVLSY